LRGVYKPPGIPDPAPTEKKLHLYIKAESAADLHKSVEIIRHVFEKGYIPSLSTVQVL